MAVAKPQMRGLLHSSIKKNLVVCLVITAVSGLAYKYIISEPKKQKYADFYKTYDAQKSFKIMRDAGLLQSVDPE